MDADASRVYRAKWIWARVANPEPFQFVKFRKTFESPVRPETATAFITADTFYRLWINDQLVMHGPARSSYGHATVDVLNVLPFLKPGRNVVTVEAFHGNVVFEALAQSPGALCEIELVSGDRKQIIATDETWQACELMSWNRLAPKFSFQRGWVEDIDSRQTEDWQPVVVIGDVGVAPWKIIETRDVPLPEMRYVEPLAPVAIHTSSTSDRSPIVEDWIGRLVAEPLEKVELPDVNTSAVTTNHAGTLVLPGSGTSVTYDFGKSHVGFVCFDVTGKAGDVIELLWTDRIYDPTGAPRPRQGIPPAQTMRYVLKDGKQFFIGFTPQLVRFLRVVNRSNGTVTIHKLGIITYHTSLPDAGDFRCSDEAMNRIYDAARLTLRLNTLDTFMDCPHRERGGWFHDSYWSALAAYTIFGDMSVHRRICRQGAESQHDPQSVGPVGTVAMVYPATLRNPGKMIPAHELMWVMQVGLDSRLSGDSQFTRAMLPAVRRLFRGLETLRNSEGLLEMQDGGYWWNFLDWADLRPGPVSVGLNCIYAMALHEAAYMERLVGDEARAREFESAAAQVRDALNRLSGDGLYYPDALVRDDSGNLVPSVESCEATQYYAMWTGVASPERTERMWKAMRDDFLPTPGKKVQPIQGLARAGLFTIFQRLQIAARLGDHQAFVRDAKAMFLPMAESVPGTLWETPWGEHSLCHGFASAIAALMTEHILGIRLGFPAVIAPHSGGSVSWCRGSVSTPKGRIAVDWELTARSYSLKVSLPDRLSATVILPEEARAVWQQAPGDDWQDVVEIGGDTRILVTPGKLVVRR